MDDFAYRLSHLSDLSDFPEWSLKPVVEAIHALRGVAAICAITLVAEIGDFGRFANPRQVMAWLGLVPRERSTIAIARELAAFVWAIATIVDVPDTAK